MKTRKLVWNDRVFAQQFEYGEQHVMRYRALVSYPWSYKIGQFNKDHTIPADNSKCRSMTQEEINEFKKARILQ